MLGRYLRACLIVAILLACSVAAGNAQPACLTTAPNSTACQQNASNPQGTDIVLGQQVTGPSRSNQSVNFTLNQLMSAGVPASFSTVAASGNANLNGNLTVGGTAALGSSLSVTGASTLHATTITGNASVSGTLGAGATTITGTLAASGNTTITGTLGVTGAITAPSISSAGNSFQIAPNAATTTFGGVAVFQPLTLGTLPGSAARGSLVWTSDCRNGSEGNGSGTGCLSYANDNGTWIQLSTPSTLQINVAGQSVFLGGTVNGQGNGSRLLTATGTFTPGNAIVTSASGTAIDGGVVPSGGGGGGGSGTVSAGTANQLSYYVTTGSAVAGLATANNAVLVTNGTGVPSESTTLPSALTVPSPTVTTALTLFGTATSAVQGNGTKVQLSTGSPTSGHCVQFDANGNTADAGGSCTTTGASGTVTSSLANQIAFYSGAGTTVVGLAIANNAVLVTNGSGIPSESTTLPSSLSIPNALLTSGATLFGTATSSVQGNGTKIQLSSGAATNGHCVQFDAGGNTIDAGGACTVGGGGGTVASATINQLAFYTGTGTVVGGLATANNAVLVTNGSGVPSESTTLPSGLIVASPVITTGLTLLGTSITSVQGNAVKIQLAAGATVSGHCAQYDASGNVIDSGGACGGAGGGGTVGNCASAPAVAFYSAAGTAITCLSQATNSVLVTNGTSIPSLATTLPASLTIPSATLSSPTTTGLATMGSATLTGALTTAASAAGGANFNCPQGTAPTSPANGNIWCTTQGMFGRFNGFTLGPFASLSGFSATTPLVYNSGTGAFTCTTCLTGASGGALSVTAPVALTGNTISVNPIIQSATVWWPANVTVTNDTAPVPNETWPWATGTIDSFTYHTGGTSTPSFVASVQINGVPVTGCTSITVSSGTDTTATCTAANAVASGQHVTVVTSAVTGSPFSAAVQVNYHRSLP